MTRVVVPLVGKADGDTVAVKSPKLFDETIIQFLVPLSGENSTMASRPDKNSTRLRQTLSCV